MFGSRAWALAAVLWALSLKVKKSGIRYEDDVSTISIVDIQCRYVNGAQVLSECRYTHLVFLPAPISLYAQTYLTLDWLYHVNTAFIFVWGFSILSVGLPLSIW